MAFIDSCASDNFIKASLLTETQRKSLGPSPPYAELAAEGMVLQLIGKIDLSPRIGDETYPGTFYVSPDLSGELVFGDTWCMKHNVIHEHRLGCIYVGDTARQRYYLIPETSRENHRRYTAIPELPHSFPPEYTSAFLNMVQLHASRFYQGGRLRQTTTVQHEIHLADPRPFREPPRKFPEEKRRWVDAQVREMLADGIIEPTTSPFSSAVVVAGKKDGDYRFCVDYRRLNDQTVDTPQCLPRIHDILKNLGTARIFSTLDLKSGYWQIPLSPDSKKYTAFSTPSGGQYQFRVMPFGLKNAPGTFQNMMRHVLAEQWGNFAIAYLDDVIIYSDTWESHLLHLSLVMERLGIYGLTCSPTKCNFGQTSLDYLGHIITDKGNLPQPKHLDAILNAEPPRTRKALQSLIGTMNWLHEYVPKYSELTAPITNLLSPKRPYRWTPEAQKALEATKAAFRNHQPLSRPDPALPFILQTDASAQGMGAVLMQQEANGHRRIIAYASAKFSATEARYHCNEQECLAIIWAIKRYRPYLEDKHFTLRTDSKTLTWLKNQKDTRAKLTRWHLLLSEYSFDIEHCPGKDNELPDALSRFPNPEEPSPGEPDTERMVPPNYQTNGDDAVTTNIPVLHAVNMPSLFKEVYAAQIEDPDISNQINEWLKLQSREQITEDEEPFLRNHRLDEQGFWKLSTDHAKWLLPAPKLLRQRIIWEYHDAPLSGHPGAEETLRAIREHFIWPGMSREIRRYVAGCHLCICCKPVHGRQKIGQRPRPARTAWETVAVDLMGPYPRSNKGNRFILVVTDMFSRWVEAFPLRQSTATKLTQVLENEVFSRWGYPRRILSDNGTQFTGHVWTEASRHWDSELWTTPAYHPQANPTERRNQEIKKGLRLRLQPGNQRTWDQYLPELLFGLRRRRNAATGSTPSDLLLGRTILLPGEWRLSTPDQTTEQKISPADDRLQREDEARGHQQQYQERYAPELTRPYVPRYAVGEWVITTNRQLSNKAAGYNAALAHLRIGPYQVVEHLAGEVYHIMKDGRIQKVHGKDLWPAPSQEPHHVGVGAQLLPQPLPEKLEADQPTSIPPRRVVDEISLLGSDSSGEDVESQADHNHQPKIAATAHPSVNSAEGTNKVDAQSHTPRLDRVNPNPESPDHAPGPSGLQRYPSFTDNAHYVAYDVAEEARRSVSGEDELQASDSSGEDQEPPDNARGRYNLRRHGSANYRDSRPYVRPPKRVL